MRYKPHDYQSYATEFIVNNPISAILLDMGLGKTAITLDAVSQLIADEEVKKVYTPLETVADNEVEASE